MTRDEHLKACIEVMTVAYLIEIRKPRLPAELMRAIFYALPKAGVRVVPAEATKEMCYVCDECDLSAALEVGDLCNPPEGNTQVIEAELTCRECGAKTWFEPHDTGCSRHNPPEGKP